MLGLETNQIDSSNIASRCQIRFREHFWTLCRKLRIREMHVIDGKNQLNRINTSCFVEQEHKILAC